MTGVRILTAAVLIPVVVAAVLLAGTPVFAGILAVVVAVCLYEFFRMSAGVGVPGHPRWTTVCGLLLVGLNALQIMNRGIWTRGEFGVLYSPDSVPVPPESALVLLLLGSAALVVMGQGSAKQALAQFGVDCAAMLLVAFPLSFLVLVHGSGALGPRIVLFLLVLLWAGDTMAYFTGRAIGKHKLAPEVSPGKTWEGAVANLAGSVAVGVVAAQWIALPVAQPRLHLAVMAALANVAGQLGDLTESAYKRSAGAKDSGSLLPGHGGMLDRIDSLIFAVPVVWYYFHTLLPVGQ